ncbi:hypothetical protein HNR44_002552 [Geomicrobium halophilum]|uniref:DUF2071 domain-containing protein n=1 Tax=Geomicrobium halophilum TaxID=549000 RepID=A0A841PP99_9BACL|nr:DUF2071 domain-containing protein [Geomicrobium halophilum]MBB6450569.1 hypothetical protein [Geomicrobium halophilum]
MFTNTSHRPFPLPKGPWFMTQTWQEVLFAHWPLSPDSLQSKIPEPLEMDTYNGNAWIGILPFHLTHLRARLLPPIPFVQTFPEINVRTYVTYRGQPGIYFFSLDASHWLTVFGARSFFHLPYHYAHIKIKKKKGYIYYYSQRENNRFEASYQPTSPVFTAAKHSLEYWLSERYRLYTSHKKQLYSLDIHHRPWQLQTADAVFTKNSLAASHQISLPSTTPLLHYAKKQKVFFWPLRRCKLEL